MTMPALPSLGSTSWYTYAQRLDTQARGLRTEAYGAAAQASNGTPTTMTTGQAATVFGSAPITVSSGVYVHTPAAGVNSAGYLQAQLSSSIDRIGCRFIAPSGATGSSIALVAPFAQWATGSLGVAGIHCVLTCDGAWNIAYWDGTTQTNYAFGQLSGSLKDGVQRRLDLTIDRESSTCYVTLPGGQVVAVTDSRIVSATSTWAVWELYEANGTGAVPMQFAEVWADSAASRGTVLAAATSKDLARAVSVAQSALQSPVAALTYAPATTGDVVAPTSLTDVDATHLTLPPIIAPASGKVLVELTGYVSMTATGQYLWAVANGGTTIATQTVVNQQYTGTLTFREVLTLTPGQTYNLKWQHFCTVASVATFKLNNGAGYHATMSATPLTT